MVKRAFCEGAILSRGFTYYIIWWLSVVIVRVGIASFPVPLEPFGMPPVGGHWARVSTKCLRFHLSFCSGHCYPCGLCDPRCECSMPRLQPSKHAKG